MNLRALVLLPLLGLAAAQTTATQTSTPQTSTPQTSAPQGTVLPAPVLLETPAVPEPVAVPVSVQPARLDNVSAVLSAPRSVKGKLPLTLTLKSSRASALKLQVPRDNEQNCVTAPTVRVLKVGTREVVYPKPGQEPRLCAQDLRSDTVPARGQVQYTRDLDLPAGEYMIEGWLTGFADDLRVKVPAQPVRVTVKSN